MCFYKKKKKKAEKKKTWEKKKSTEKNLTMYHPAAVFLAFSEIISLSQPDCPAVVPNLGSQDMHSSHQSVLPVLVPRGTKGCHQQQVCTTALTTISGAWYAGSIRTVLSLQMESVLCVKEVSVFVLLNLLLRGLLNCLKGLMLCPK